MPDVYDELAAAVQTAVAVIAPSQTEVIKREKVPPLSLSDEEALLIKGDLEGLTAEGRVKYYKWRCESLGLDPLSAPFDYIRVPGAIRGTFKLVLYANKECSKQLSNRHHVSVTILKEEVDTGVLRVYVRASKPIIIDNVIIGHRDFDDLGAVAVAGKGGDDLANLRMKAVTKATRRVILGICGVGANDESEMETIKGAIRIDASEAEALGQRFDAPRQVSIDVRPAQSQLSSVQSTEGSK